MEKKQPSPPQSQDFNQTRDQVIQYLSHELKTPLAVLGACLKLLKKKLPHPPGRQWDTIYERALRSLERLTDMEYEIEDILRRRKSLLSGKLSQMLEAAGDSSPQEEAPRDDSEKFLREVNIEFLIHELKDPLSVVESNSTLLIEKQDDRHPLSKRQANALDRMQRNIKKTRSMLGQLLEVGRAEARSFHCQPFKPEPILREVLIETLESNAPDLFAEVESLPAADERFTCLARHGIRLEVSAAAQTVALCHDETKFRQIVANLLKNALDYRRRLLLVHVSARRERISIAIRDDGPGIAPQHQEAVFQRYRQVNPLQGLARSGHGLGLAVSRILARSMGGDIVLESQLGQGALFNLDLPFEYRV